jgi:hypothetical protein
MMQSKMMLILLRRMMMVGLVEEERVELPSWRLQIITGTIWQNWSCGTILCRTSRSEGNNIAVENVGIAGIDLHSIVIKRREVVQLHHPCIVISGSWSAQIAILGRP